MTTSHRKKNRLFFSHQLFQQEGQEVCLSAEESSHLTRVLRLDVGDLVKVCNGMGQLADAKVLDTHPGKVVLGLEVWSTVECQGPKIVLHVAMAQHSKMEDIVEKAQELQVAELEPLLTVNTENRYDEKKQSKILERWQKKCVGALKQSHASHLMDLKPLIGFSDFLSENRESECVLILDPHDAEGIPFKSYLESASSTDLKEMHLVIGPEGGFSEDEIKLFKNKKQEFQRDYWSLIKLGDSILRMETAVVSAVSFLRIWQNG